MNPSYSDYVCLGAKALFAKPDILYLHYEDLNTYLYHDGVFDVRNTSMCRKFLHVFGRVLVDVQFDLYACAQLLESTVAFSNTIGRLLNRGFSRRKITRSQCTSEIVLLDKEVIFHWTCASRQGSDNMVNLLFMVDHCAWIITSNAPMEHYVPRDLNMWSYWIDWFSGHFLTPVEPYTFNVDDDADRKHSVFSVLTVRDKVHELINRIQDITPIPIDDFDSDLWVSSLCNREEGNVNDRMTIEQLATLIDLDPNEDTYTRDEYLNIVTSYISLYCRVTLKSYEKVMSISFVRSHNIVEEARNVLDNMRITTSRPSILEETDV